VQPLLTRVNHGTEYVALHDHALASYLKLVTSVGDSAQTTSHDIVPSFHAHGAAAYDTVERFMSPSMSHVHSSLPASLLPFMIT
jgi:hypothetical protein